MRCVGVVPICVKYRGEVDITFKPGVDVIIDDALYVKIKGILDRYVMKGMLQVMDDADYLDGNDSTYFVTKVEYSGVVVVSESATLTGEHGIVFVDASEDAVTIVLPLAEEVAGRRFVFKRVDASENFVEISPQNEETIDGMGSLSLGNWDCVELFSNGTNWFVLGRYTVSS